MPTTVEAISASDVPVQSRRMVTILVESMPIKDERTTGNGSGFVIWFEGKQWLVTAGHVADALQKVYRAGRLYSVSLCDAWSGNDGLGRPVVLPVDFMTKWIILGNESSYDVAILELGTNLAAQLEVGHIEAVPEHRWRNPPDQFDYYELVGTPAEKISVYGAERDGLNVDTAPIPPKMYEVRRGVVRLEQISPPASATITPHIRFHGKGIKLPDAIRIYDIAGVSGGPILGCINEPAGGLSYHTIAVQSAWYPDKTIVANYLHLLPEILKGNVTT